MSKTLKEKREDFLLDTIQHYTSKNRGVKQDQRGHSTVCLYRKNCAIGRKIDDPALKEEMDRVGGTPAEFESENPGIWSKMPESLRELGSGFLNSVQRLHDMDEFWCERGLTALGRGEVRHIRFRWDLDVPTDCVA